MALVRWNPTMPWRPSQESWSPFTGMESLRAEMDHLFNESIPLIQFLCYTVLSKHRRAVWQGDLKA